MSSWTGFGTAGDASASVGWDLDAPGSVRELLSQLAGIEETLLLYPSTGGRPRASRMITEMNPTQQRLFDLFDLTRYAHPHDRLRYYNRLPENKSDQAKHEARSQQGGRSR